MVIGRARVDFAATGRKACLKVILQEKQSSIGTRKTRTRYIDDAAN
jgi:hypothetical protein